MTVDQAAQPLERCLVPMLHSLSSHHYSKQFDGPEEEGVAVGRKGVTGKETTHAIEPLGGNIARDRRKREPKTYRSEGWSFAPSLGCEILDRKGWYVDVESSATLSHRPFDEPRFRCFGMPRGHQLAAQFGELGSKASSECVVAQRNHLLVRSRVLRSAGDQSGIALSRARCLAINSE